MQVGSVECGLCEPTMESNTADAEPAVITTQNGEVPDVGSDFTNILAAFARNQQDGMRKV